MKFKGLKMLSITIFIFIFCLSRFCIGNRSGITVGTGTACLFFREQPGDPFICARCLWGSPALCGGGAGN